MCDDVDIDECSPAHYGCDTHASCSNTVGSFACACNPGFTGNGLTCTGMSVEAGLYCDIDLRAWTMSHYKHLVFAVQNCPHLNNLMKNPFWTTSHISSQLFTVFKVTSYEMLLPYTQKQADRQITVWIKTHHYTRQLIQYIHINVTLPVSNRPFKSLTRLFLTKFETLCKPSSVRKQETLSLSQTSTVQLLLTQC